MLGWSSSWPSSRSNDWSRSGSLAPPCAWRSSRRPSRAATSPSRSNRPVPATKSIVSRARSARWWTISPTWPPPFARRPARRPRWPARSPRDSQEMSSSAGEIAYTATDLSTQSSTMAEGIKTLASSAGELVTFAGTLDAGAREGVQRNARLRELAVENRSRLDDSSTALETLVGGRRTERGGGRRACRGVGRSAVVRVARPSARPPVQAALAQRRDGSRARGRARRRLRRRRG